MAEGPAPVANALPPSPGLTGAGRAASIYAEQVRHLYRLSLSAYAGSFLCALVVVGALWDVVPALPLIGWGLGLTAVLAARYALYRAFFRRQPAEQDARRWCAYFIAGAAAAGLAWGVLGSALYPSGSMPHEFVVILVICGMVISAVLVLSPVHQAFLAFLMPAALPLIPTLFFQGTTLHFYLGVLLLIFLVVMLTAGPLVSQMLKEAIAMKFDNSELIAQISDAHAASRQAVRQLNEQVYAQRLTAGQLRQASQKLAAMIAASPLAIVVRDAQGRVESWNAAAERIFGWSQEEVLGAPAPFHPPGKESEPETFRRQVLSGETLSGSEAVYARKDGRAIDVSVSAALIHDIEGRPAGYLTIVADITERKRVEKQQHVISSVTVLLAEAHSVEDAIPHVLASVCESFGFDYGARWVLDKQNLLLRCAETWSRPLPALERFREHSKARVERPGNAEGLTRQVWASGAPVWIADIAADATLQRREAALEAGLRSAFAFPVMVGGEFYGLMEFFSGAVRQPDPGVMHVAQNASAHIGHFIARKQAERNLQFVATHDSLTGLFNRSMFGQRLHQALAQAHRHERRLAVLFIDLDGFKLINDVLGHDAGDVLLADLAVRLRECMREGDTLGRMGGDEFVVLIEGYGEDTQLLEVARKVLETVAQPFVLRDGRYNVTASIGIAAYPQDGTDATELIKNADIAMYRAKDQGKNNFQFFSPDMNVHLVERYAMVSALRAALERSELALYYQPRVRVGENRITGVEGLLRWRHPEQGLLGPSAFLPVAEEAGLVGPIGDWVLEAACAQLKAWHERGAASLSVAVNLSMRQFAQDNLIERLRKAVHAAGIDPHRLEIEINESMLMRHAERAGKVLAEVKAFGAKVVVDDFGTGDSSLACLSRFPIDTVKIDRSLVARLPHAAEGAALTRAVIAMAHNLGLDVVAEGVETRAQWDFLSEHRCNAVQGNYYCAPAPAQAIGELLLEAPYSAVRTANVERLRPWRASRPGESSD